MGIIVRNSGLGFFTLLKREINRFMKVYVQTLLAPLFSNMLFLGVFGGMLKTRDVGIAGIGYLSFLVPGLAAMGAVFAAFQNPSFSLISQKYQQTIKDLNSYPLSAAEKTMAFVLGGTFRGMFIGSLTYVATIYFVGYRIAYPAIFFSMLTVISFIFASLGLIVGLVVDSMERMNFILSIILTPLAYFGGVFFEVSRLPGILPAIASVNPLFPLINLLRFGYLGIHEGNIPIQVLYIILTASASLGTAFYLMKKGTGLTD